MERTPSPVHIPVVATGDDNARLAVDEAGVVIGDRIGPLIAEDAPLRVPRPYRCIRRITRAQGVSVLATPICGQSSTLRSRWATRAPVECFGVEDLAARAGCIKGLARPRPDRDPAAGQSDRADGDCKNSQLDRPSITEGL